MAASPVTQAFPNSRTLVALTKEAVAGRMKMLRCMCDSGWAVVNISSQASPRPGRGETRTRARVAELADALASGASDRKVVEVRVLSRAPSFVYVRRWNVASWVRRSVVRLSPLLQAMRPLRAALRSSGQATPSRLRVNRRTPKGFLVNDNHPTPYFFLQIASKGLSYTVSLLFAILAGRIISVASKGVRGDILSHFPKSRTFCR